MKIERLSQCGFSSPRVLLGLILGSMGVLLVLVGFGLSTGTSALAQGAGVPAPVAKIAMEVLADTADGKSASVVIFLADQADVSAAYSMKDQDARGWFVYNTLTQHAVRTQADLQVFLTARGATYQSYWAANMIIAAADRSLVESLAARADVARIDPNRPARWIEDPELANFQPAPENPDDPNAIEWGVNNVNAPAVWAQGFNGQGMVIGGLDTGIRWTHSALRPKYRGWNGTTADHNFNWHDAIHVGGSDCGANTVAPCDDSGHGTHTVGTVVGESGNNQIGVAPGAKWIGCRNMNDGVGTPATYTECFQFMIAPTDLAGNNANPALRPHVLNNSWGCPVSEGCVTGAELETIVNNTQAAGIFVAVSAGNSGAGGCETVEDAPAIYDASFSVGSITINNALSSFSSRGPSTFYTPNILKPNVSAPGSNVRSCYNSSDTSYGALSGTSMASPHVAGVVALMWSAHPHLVRDIGATKSLLENTANPSVTAPAQTCGGTPSTQIPNNIFGYGRVDAYAAFFLGVVTPTPTPITTPTPTPTSTPTPTATPTPTPTVTATPSSTPPAQAVNLSTRMRVQTGDNVGIGGFIISGTGPKNVLLRAMGPSLSKFGVPNPLPDPVLELHGTGTFVTITNNDWQDNAAQAALIMSTGLAPNHNLDSAIYATLNPGAYTAIVRGNNNTTGVALVEVYDLSQDVAAKLANISTRAFINTGDDIVIAGFILGNQSGNDRIIVRGIGPSLTALGVPNALANPTLELRNSNGALLFANNDWQEDPAQAAELTAAGLAPTNQLESGIAATLAPGLYTALLAGVSNGTGVGVVEVYDRGAP
jgi:serine protease AprX